MRLNRIVFSLSILVLASLACKTVTGLASPGNGIPAMLTEVPTALEALGTAAAEITPPVEVATTGPDSGSNTPSTTGLGISVDNIKTIMQASQQFTFTDETVNGQPAVVARLSSTAAAAMPAGADFSAAFIGDSSNLGEIKISMPYSTDQTAVDSAMGMVTVLFASILPPDVLFTFLPWLTENYSKVPDGGSQQMTAGKFKFTLSRSQSIMLLDILPAQ